MKRILFVSLCLVCLCKANAQPNYDVEIDGLCYSLNLNESTAMLVYVQPTVSAVDVPSSVFISGRSFDVDIIRLYCTYYDCSYIRSIQVPNTIVELTLLFGGQNDSFFPTISSLSIPNSVELIKLNGIKGLTSITIPSAVKEVGLISYLPNLRELIIEDGGEELRWLNKNYQFEGTPADLEYVYLGRQLIRTDYGYPDSFFGTGLYPDNAVVGSYVRDLKGYNLYPQSNVIPNTVRKGYLGEDSFGSYGETTPISVVFNDGCERWECAYYGFGKLWKSVPVWYIGRPGVELSGVRAKQLTIGPLLTSQQASEFFYGFGDAAHWVKGDNSFVKLYQFYPPATPSFTLYGLFDNETFMNTPLYVPMGSKSLYEQADVWRNFFNIIEFDWEAPECSIEIINNNPELGTVEGAGVYHLGDTVTLSASPISGYAFLEWSEFGEQVSSERCYTFVIDRDRTLTASFCDGYNVYIDAYPNNNNYGSVEGGGSYPYGAIVTLRAIPNEGFSFESWIDLNGLTEVCVETEYVFVAERPKQLVACFGATGVDENTDISDLLIIAKNKTIQVFGDNDISEVIVYTLTGQCVYRGSKKVIPVPDAGVYIVIVDNKRLKVVVE